MNSSLYNGRIQNLIKGLLPLANTVHPIKTNYYVKKYGSEEVEVLEIGIYKYAKITFEKFHDANGEDNMMGSLEFYNINRNKKSFEKKLGDESSIINSIENLVIDKNGSVTLQVEYIIESGEETITISREFTSEAYKLFIRKVFFYLKDTEKEAFQCYRNMKAQA
ncbi:MAG: hypothetical protein RR620_12610 [Clostridium sp.]|uniref:hypothetical protein n=1 Tax=Anaerorhabdus sp. TaxID=1872524 RepID=UPI002FCA509E